MAGRPLAMSVVFLLCVYSRRAVLWCACLLPATACRCRPPSVAWRIVRRLRLRLRLLQCQPTWSHPLASCPVVLLRGRNILSFLFERKRISYTSFFLTSRQIIRTDEVITLHHLPLKEKRQLNFEINSKKYEHLPNRGFGRFHHKKPY